jgi:hypothetical protein
LFAVHRCPESIGSDEKVAELVLRSGEQTIVVLGVQ